MTAGVHNNSSSPRPRAYLTFYVPGCSVLVFRKINGTCNSRRASRIKDRIYINIYQRSPQHPQAVYVASRRVQEQAKWVSAGRIPSSKHVRQLRGSIDRRWRIAVWRDCANDGGRHRTVAALPMSRVIAQRPANSILF